jgi:hypothetical protein
MTDFLTPYYFEVLKNIIGAVSLFAIAWMVGWVFGYRTGIKDGRMYVSTSFRT